MKLNFPSSGKWINISASIRHGTGKKLRATSQPASSAANSLMNMKSFQAGAAKERGGLPGSGNLGKREVCFLPQSKAELL